jgi:hypothetical protein
MYMNMHKDIFCEYVEESLYETRRPAVCSMPSCNRTSHCKEYFLDMKEMQKYEGMSGDLIL